MNTNGTRDGTNEIRPIPTGEIPEVPIFLKSCADFPAPPHLVILDLDSRTRKKARIFTIYWPISSSNLRWPCI
ncbi:unnamed protein product [Rotaria socialis]